MAHSKTKDLSNLLMFLRSVITTKIPAFFAEGLVSVSDTHGHSTRGASNGHLALPRPRSNVLKNTIIYRSISLWNELPENITFSINSKYNFKRSAKNHLVHV